MGKIIRETAAELLPVTELFEARIIGSIRERAIMTGGILGYLNSVLHFATEAFSGVCSLEIEFLDLIEEKSK